MSVFIYTADFREKDGEVLSPLDTSSNIEDIKSAANALTWKNIEDDSLDTYHLALGERTKLAEGRHVSLPVVAGNHTTLVSSVTFPASEGDGVFVVGNINYDGALAGGNKPNRSTMTILASSISPDGATHSEGSLQHTHVDNPEQHGQAGVVFAYQAKSGGGEGYVHTVKLIVNLAVGTVILPPMIEPLRGSLVVFVVHR
tara:strand:- start:1566 stop:2165 length:600 start_codon:yes stop_codon:yes gene_type:complete